MLLQSFLCCRVWEEQKEETPKSGATFTKMSNFTGVQRMPLCERARADFKNLQLTNEGALCFTCFIGEHQDGCPLRWMDTQGRRMERAKWLERSKTMLDKYDIALDGSWEVTSIAAL